MLIVITSYNEIFKFFELTFGISLIDFATIIVVMLNDNGVMLHSIEPIENIAVKPTDTTSFISVLRVLILIWFGSNISFMFSLNCSKLR